MKYEEAEYKRIRNRIKVLSDERLKIDKELSDLQNEMAELKERILKEEGR